ncbi:MAG TPA: tetratricopeptide repeat protein [Candidatus Acidoferrales bacterium]|nr:tetratricopeptide repeat protein [Candidatus Acidoferrales bacterium]
MKELRTLAIVVALILSSPCARGQAPSNPPPPPAKKTAPVPPAEPDQPVWNPLRAEKAIEVGKFYMKKGDYDAAIDRFKDAAAFHPGYALPFKLLGEAQEKKGLKSEAVKSYEQYLKLYPHAEDGEKIQKHIDKLYQQLDRAKKKPRSG